MLALLLVAVAVGVSNFAAAIAIGVSGVDARTRVRVGLVFGAFEAGMPLIGLAIGAQLAGSLGHAARWAGAATLVGVGAYGLIDSVRRGPGAVTSASGIRLLLSGLALSLDNLVVGFALGSLHVGFVVAAAVIAVFSVGMSLVGLEIGNRVSASVETRSEVVGGLVLVGVGVAVAAGLLG